MLLLFAVAGEPLLRVVFGEDLTDASDALPLLGLAMSLLACTYLCVQYLLAMGRSRFIAILVAAALAEVVAPDRHRRRPHDAWRLAVLACAGGVRGADAADRVARPASRRPS